MALTSGRRNFRPESPPSFGEFLLRVCSGEPGELEEVFGLLNEALNFIAPPVL